MVTLPQYKIIILTSAGICAINQLSLDDGLVDVGKSIATISGGKKSKINYHDFVSIDVGVIKRRTHHGNYRLVLSQDINHGNSWQLGVYIAHLLYHYGHDMAASDYQHLIFVTGEIKLRDNGIDIDILPIDLIDEKIVHIVDMVHDDAQYQHIKKTIIVPQGNIDETLHACKHHNIDNKIDIVAIHKETDIFDYFNYKFDAIQTTKAKTNKWAYILFLMILFSLSLSAIGAPFLMQYYKTTEKIMPKKQDKEIINITPAQSNPLEPTPKSATKSTVKPNTEKLRPLVTTPAPTTPAKEKETQQPEYKESKKQKDKKRFKW